MSTTEPCSPRLDVQVQLPDGRTFCGRPSTPLREFLDATDGNGLPVLAGLVENRLRELDWPVEHDCAAEPVSLAAESGYRLYQDSAVLLLEAAIRELFPEVRLEVEHSVPFGGLFCEILHRRTFTSDELAAIEQRMRTFVDDDEPIGRDSVSMEEARKLFRKEGDEGRLQLFDNPDEEKITLRRLGEATLPSYTPLLPSAGRIRDFALCLHPPGFILRLPQRNRLELSPVQNYPKLAQVFEEHNRYLGLLGVQDVGALNAALKSGRGRELMLIGESLHAQRISEITHQIIDRPTDIRVVLIAGPSSAGKTSFAKRLAIQMLSNGRRPFPLSLDDYYLPRIDSPRDSNGKPDYDGLEALDLKLLNEQLLDLVAGKTVSLPKYNFHSGEREKGTTVQLGPKHVLLIEGLHGLNPSLVPRVPKESIFRVYVSALTQLRLDRVTRIPTTDSRVIRRIARDAQSRGYDAQKTLESWASVRFGEERNIFPYQETADAIFNSAMPHELSVLRPLAEPLLRQVEPDSPEYPEARRLLNLLEWFDPCELEFVPGESILREFVGGSVVVDFVPKL